MLELRPNCEHCGKKLPNTSTEAMICSFEFTYNTCALGLFENVCLSCGGNFQPRPIRTKSMIDIYPSSLQLVCAPKGLEYINNMKEKYSKLEPQER